MIKLVASSPEINVVFENLYQDSSTCTTSPKGLNVFLHKGNLPTLLQMEKDNLDPYNRIRSEICYKVHRDWEVTWGIIVNIHKHSVQY